MACTSFYCKGTWLENHAQEHNTFYPQRFLHKNYFSPRLPPFVPISVNTSLRNTLIYPSTLGGHTLNAAARFMTYPKF